MRVHFIIFYLFKCRPGFKCVLEIVHPFTLQGNSIFDYFKSRNRFQQYFLNSFFHPILCFALKNSLQSATEHFDI
uniref:Uncharacterized protein n=1 Tax=Anguilla anguilla TaxID=7936 RepID=A0A0E9XTH5_ANGAN